MGSRKVDRADDREAVVAARTDGKAARTDGRECIQGEAKHRAAEGGMAMAWLLLSGLSFFSIPWVF
jgi:hypothetical protein